MPQERTAANQEIAGYGIHPGENPAGSEESGSRNQSSTVRAWNGKEDQVFPKR